MPLCGLQQRGYCHFPSFRGVATIFRVPAEGMLPLSGYSRGDSATLWVTAEGILPLSVFQRGCYNFQGSSRGDAATLWVTAEGMLPLSGLQQRGYCHSLGYSRGDTSTVSAGL